MFADVRYYIYICSMNTSSNSITKEKMSLKRLANIQSGVYIKGTPTGNVACLQVKDIILSSPEKTAIHVEFSPKIENYILRKGDLLFAGKGTTYLCQVFNFDILAIPSTTLYAIRLRTNKVSPEYLCWYMNHPKVRAMVKSAQVGTGSPLIHKSTLENLEIIVPDRETQQQIVELANLQKREAYLINQIMERKTQITNQILINELNK